VTLSYMEILYMVGGACMSPLPVHLRILQHNHKVGAARQV
jgi:hypothetical protein